MSSQGNGRQQSEAEQQLRRSQASLQAARKTLGNAVLALVEASRGQDDGLDELLDELRTQLGQDLPSPVLIDRLAGNAKALRAIRRSRAEKQLQGFSDCVAQLLQFDPPPELKKSLASFIRNARRHIANPAEQELLPIKFARIQRQTLPTIVGNREADPATALVDGDDADIVAHDIEAMVKDPSLDGLPAFNTVAESIESVLTDLLVQMRPAEAARKVFDEARQQLARGLNWYELGALLESLSQAILLSLNNDQHEFECFLQSLNAQLTGLSSGVDGVHDVTREVFANDEQFDGNLRHEFREFANELESADSLPALEAVVTERLASLGHTLESHSAEREQLKQGYEQELERLRERVETLEKQAEEAQQEIDANQRRNEIDSLTELPNREAYVRRFAIELERGERYERSFCLVVADVDHFKSINDQFGHLAGDKVLRVLAKTMRQRLRRADFIARYGGEEFVILLPETAAAEALKVMNDVCRQIRECPFHFKSDPLQITVSFGIAQFIVGDDADSLFSRADEALYAAKRGGRDRCELAQGAA